MSAATIVALAIGMVSFHGVVATPPSLAPTFLQLDSPACFRVAWTSWFVFFFLALFDSIGTLVGVANHSVAARRHVAAGATGAARRRHRHGCRRGSRDLDGDRVHRELHRRRGRRTHRLANVVTAALFLLSPFFYPLVGRSAAASAGGVPVLYPIVAPALILVGALMMEGVREISGTT